MLTTFSSYMPLRTPTVRQKRKKKERHVLSSFLSYLDNNSYKSPNCYTSYTFVNCIWVKKNSRKNSYFRLLFFWLGRAGLLQTSLKRDSRCPSFLQLPDSWHFKAHIFIKRCLPRLFPHSCTKWGHFKLFINSLLTQVKSFMVFWP